MSNDKLPKCPNPTCESTEFDIKVNRYLSDANNNTIQFVFCKKCGTTVGVLPYDPDQ